jgi:hypothetical protein
MPLWGRIVAILPLALAAACAIYVGDTAVVSVAGVCAAAYAGIVRLAANPRRRLTRAALGGFMLLVVAGMGEFAYIQYLVASHPDRGLHRIDVPPEVIKQIQDSFDIPDVPKHAP